MAARRPLLLIVLPLALAACGGSSSSSVKGDPLGAAVRNTLAQKSESVTLQAKVDLSGQSVTAQGTGAFAPGRGQMHLSFKLPLIGSSTLDERVVGTTTWVRSPLIGKKWARIGGGKGATVSGVDLQALTGATPRAALALLQHDDKLTSLGQDTVGGVRTTHYRLDLAGMTSGGTRYNSAEAWVDQQNLVRKMKLDFDADISSAGGTAHTVLTTVFSDFGAAVSVTPPPASEVSG